jgi:hypothetical protein
LIWAVLGKSLIFAILLLAFHIVEEVIRVWLESEPLSTAFVDFGGTLPGFAEWGKPGALSDSLVGADQSTVTRRFIAY